MTPRRRVHPSAAARSAAYRERLALQGRVSMNVRVRKETVERIKAEAKARGCSMGEALEALLAEK